VLLTSPSKNREQWNCRPIWTGQRCHPQPRLISGESFLPAAESFLLKMGETPSRKKENALKWPDRRVGRPAFESLE